MAESAESGPLAAILLSLKKDGKEPGSDAQMPPKEPGSAGREGMMGEVGGGAEPADDLTIAAEEFVSATQSGDPAAVASAFRSMFELCLAGGSVEEESDAPAPSPFPGR